VECGASWLLRSDHQEGGGEHNNGDDHHEAAQVLYAPEPAFVECHRFLRFSAVIELIS
jgi:hypothetical protein